MCLSVCFSACLDIYRFANCSRNRDLSTATPMTRRSRQLPLERSTGCITRSVSSPVLSCYARRELPCRYSTSEQPPLTRRVHIPLLHRPTLAVASMRSASCGSICTDREVLTVLRSLRRRPGRIQSRRRSALQGTGIWARISGHDPHLAVAWLFSLLLHLLGCIKEMLRSRLFELRSRFDTGCRKRVHVLVRLHACDCYVHVA